MAPLKAASSHCATFRLPRSQHDRQSDKVIKVQNGTRYVLKRPLRDVHNNTPLTVIP